MNRREFALSLAGASVFAKNVPQATAVKFDDDYTFVIIKTEFGLLRVERLPGRLSIDGCICENLNKCKCNGMVTRHEKDKNCVVFDLPVNLSGRNESIIAFIDSIVKFKNFTIDIVDNFCNVMFYKHCLFNDCVVVPFLENSDCSKITKLSFVIVDA